ncbi:MAG TPA: hypothetical protein DDZ88_28965 [Verrucomicrobiales bacterium]|nr:hypothetical protein [Verrucomicrobiales bacterium]
MLMRNVRTQLSSRGRLMKSLARLAFPLSLAAMAVLLVIQPEWLVIDRSLGFGIVLVILFPTMLLESFVMICRRVRTVHCHGCAWEKDFPFVAKLADQTTMKTKSSD